ncbi:unnamed protein product [Polarella glacialis]|uniref:Uncharacterized protein n=1 Tax=Polarella glacialis TaxID=89957 RepID=A0A813EAS3_POLGL|nr:unnamed protein product [Polarella glacialis]CAE8683890.1 unnamed protein product [Polarella glacialis]
MEDDGKADMMGMMGALNYGDEQSVTVPGGGIVSKREDVFVGSGSGGRQEKSNRGAPVDGVCQRELRGCPGTDGRGEGLHPGDQKRKDQADRREQEGGFSDGGFEKHGMGGRVKAFVAFLHFSSSFSESGIVVAAILAIPEELRCTDFKQAWRRRCGSEDADGFDQERKPRVARWWNDGVWDLVVGRDASFPSCFRET